MATVSAVCSRQLTSLERGNMTTHNRVCASAASADVDAVRGYFEGECDGEQVLGKRDEAGRSVLAVAAMLGRSADVRELVGLGAQVDEQTVRGYSALHFAACWGRVDTARTLLELGADVQARTSAGETPEHLARKCSKAACADLLAAAAARRDLTSYVASIRDAASGSEGNLTLEERNMCLGVCSAISTWIGTVENPTVADFTARRKDAEDKLQSILSKTSAQRKY